MRVRHVVGSGLLVACLGAGTALAGDGTTAADAVNAALAEAAPAKLSVAETFAQTGRWVRSNEAIGFEAPEGASHSINVGNHGAITIAFTGPAEVAGGTIVLTPSDGGNGRVEWACTTGNLPSDAVPQGCE